MLYGPGDSEVYIMSMEVDASENILVGGRSKLVQTTVGEGFVFLVDKYGEHLFSKTYASGASAGDVINKVDIVGTTYVAVGTSDTGTNTFFLLAISAAGVVSKNLVIAQDTSKIANTASIYQMYLQGTEAHIVFDNSVVNIIDVSGAADDYYVGITGEINDSKLIRIVSHNGNLQYSIFAVLDGNFATYWYDTVVPGNSKNVDAHHTTAVSTDADLLTSDVDNDLNPTGCWIGTWVSPYVSNFHAFHWNINTALEYPRFSTAVINNLPFPPISLSIVYNTGTTFYMSAMLNNQQGSVYYISGAVQINKRVALNLHGTYFKAAVTGALFISAGNKIGGESTSLLSSQAILFKSDLALNFALYNCYAVAIADTLTVAIYAVTAGTIDTATRIYVTGTSSQTSNTIIPADSTGHVIRAESTQTSTAPNFCVLQPPTFAFIDQTYSTSVDDPTTVKNMVTQCQGAFLEFTPTVGGAAVLWAPGGTDSMTIKPSTVTSTHCCNTPNTVSVIAYAVNSVTNPATDTIDITFINVPPVLVTPIANQVLYNGQGAVTLTGLSITSSNTLTFSIATNVTSADYTALSIDTTDGDPITIAMATSFIGTATFTVSATDSNGLVTTTTFDVVVGVCTQSDCSI